MLSCVVKTLFLKKEKKKKKKKKRINHCSNNLTDEPHENIICSDLRIIEEPRESLSDNIIVNSEF